MSVALLFLSTSAVYATDTSDDSGSGATPHEEISDIEDPSKGETTNTELTEEEIAEDLATDEATKTSFIEESNFKVTGYNEEPTTAFTID